MRIQNEYHPAAPTPPPSYAPTPPPGYAILPPPGFNLFSPPVPPTAAPRPILDLPQANAVLLADPNAAVLQAMMRNMQLMHDNMHQTFHQGHGCGYGRGRGYRGRNGQQGQDYGNQGQRDRNVGNGY